MSQKKNNKEESPLPIKIPKITISETKKRIIIASFLIIISVISFLGFFHGGGIIGRGLAKAFSRGFGFISPIVSIVLGIVSISIFRKKPVFKSFFYTTGWLTFFVTILGLLHLSIFGEKGGIFGEFFASIFSKLFGLIGGILVLGFGFILSLIVITNKKPDFQTFVDTLKNYFSKIFGFVKNKSFDTLEKIKNTEIKIPEVNINNKVSKENLEEENTGEKERKYKRKKKKD
jgi:hypothetical protein